MLDRIADWLDRQPPGRRRLYSLFLALALLTVPCYAAGVALWTLNVPGGGDGARVDDGDATPIVETAVAQEPTQTALPPEATEPPAAPAPDEDDDDEQPAPSPRPPTSIPAPAATATDIVFPTAPSTATSVASETPPPTDEPSPEPTVAPTDSPTEVPTEPPPSATPEGPSGPLPTPIGRITLEP